MYPFRSDMEYNMNDIERLFQRNDADVFNPLGSSPSVSRPQSLAQSSSSAETSPDSYPDITARFFRPDLHEEPNLPSRQHFEKQDFFHSKQDFFDFKHDAKPSFQETPFLVRRPRPIVGRKIINSTENIPRMDDPLMWQPDEFLPKTPPNNTYELFPTGNRGYSSPIKTLSVYSSSPNNPISPRMLSPVLPMSPIIPNISPNKPNMSSMSSVPNLPSPFKEPLATCLPFRRATDGVVRICSFCRKNGEAPVVFNSHVVKARVGNKQIVTCPILRSHVCSTCGASGDDAHTITYCPVLRTSNNGQPLKSTTITLKNTRFKSNGRRRY